MKNDRCCGKCRTPFSVCAKKRDCSCHENARIREIYIGGNFNPTPKPAANVTPIFQEPTP